MNIIGGNVGHPQSNWRNKKYGKRTYTGHYRKVDGEREFILIAKLKNGNYHTVSFESSKMAQLPDVGWKLLNPRKAKTRKQKRTTRRKK